MASPRTRILIVEDDRVLRRACEKGLEQAGYEVAAAQDGEEALRQVEAQPPDVILLDLLIPKIPGLEVLRSLKADARTKHIPVVVLTNSSRDQTRDRAAALGAEAFLVKSNLSLRELREHVKRVRG